MTFCPEWLTGSPNLNTSNGLYLWVYLVVCPADNPSLVLTDSRFVAVHERNVSQKPPLYIEYLLTEADADGLLSRFG